MDMKKLISVAIVLMMVLGLMVPAFSSAEEVIEYMWANRADGRCINIHETADENSKILYRVDCGAKVELVPASFTVKGWTLVRKEGKAAGYVKSKFLMEKKPGKYEYTEQEDSFSSVTAYTVTAVALNAKTDKSVCLREKPNKISESLRRLSAGDQLEVIAEGKTWSKVIDLSTGKTGYVANDYLSRA